MLKDGLPKEAMQVCEVFMANHKEMSDTCPSRLEDFGKVKAKCQALIDKMEKNDKQTEDKPIYFGKNYKSVNVKTIIKQ